MGVPGGSQGDDFKAKARQSGEGCADWVPTFGFGLESGSFQIKWSCHLQEILRSSFDVSPRRCEELLAAPDVAHPTTDWHHVCVSHCLCVFVGCELFEVQRTCSRVCFTLSMSLVREASTEKISRICCCASISGFRGAPSLISTLIQKSFLNHGFVPFLKPKLYIVCLEKGWGRPKSNMYGLF